MNEDDLLAAMPVLAEPALRCWRTAKILRSSNRRARLPVTSRARIIVVLRRGPPTPKRKPSRFSRGRRRLRKLVSISCMFHLLPRSDLTLANSKLRAYRSPQRRARTIERLPREDISDGATEIKCAPAIREAENRDGLWSGLGDGTVDFIASDHSPCPLEMKRKESGDFSQPGAASRLWSCAYRPCGLGVPAAILGLSGGRGGAAARRDWQAYRAKGAPSWKGATPTS